MKKIIAFGASSSKKSINRMFANYTAGLLENTTVEHLDLNEFEMPIYSIDREEELNGVPDLAMKFKSLLENADGIVVSFAEHNGNVTAAFKNVYDWVSRINPTVWSNKPMFVLATSPGARGGQNVLDVVVPGIKRQNKSEVVVFSLPSFFDNFKNEITNSDLKLLFQSQLALFQSAL